MQRIGPVTKYLWQCKQKSRACFLLVLQFIDCGTDKRMKILKAMVRLLRKRGGAGFFKRFVKTIQFNDQISKAQYHHHIGRYFQGIEKQLDECCPYYSEAIKRALTKHNKLYDNFLHYTSHRYRRRTERFGQWKDDGLGNMIQGQLSKCGKFIQGPGIMIRNKGISKASSIFVGDFNRYIQPYYPVYPDVFANRRNYQMARMFPCMLLTMWISPDTLPNRRLRVYRCNQQYRGETNMVQRPVKRFRFGRAAATDNSFYSETSLTQLNWNEELFNEPTGNQ